MVELRIIFAAITCIFSYSVIAGINDDVVELKLDLKKVGDSYRSTQFGINTRWLDSGDGMVVGGEMIRDRSFRNQKNKTLKVWFESPERSTGGKLKYHEKGGATDAWGGRTYPGYYRLSQKGSGFTCISQQVIGRVRKGAEYQLNLSAVAENGEPALGVFFANMKFLPIEEIEAFKQVASGRWSNYSFTLKPREDANSALIRICLVNSGSLKVDEVRLSLAGQQPTVLPSIDQRIQELGASSLRWPSGSDADHFDWRNSVGPVRSRGESPNAFGAYQTPSWGLHEFLDYCERRKLEPLITVNVVDTPQSAAELVEYILGDSSTKQGALRARNGRENPWDVVHFELGNEPTKHYRGEESSRHAGRGYSELAANIAVSMRDKAAILGKQIELKGVLETTFTQASWLWLVPILSNWNEEVLSAKNPLRSKVDQFKGHFYSAFNWRDDDREMFSEVMAGGATLARTVNGFRESEKDFPDFWLTEYSIMLEKKNPSRIQIDRLKDYQTGLGVADILITALNERYSGAYLFNLSEHGTWGVLASQRGYVIRPAGLAFSMLSKLLGADRLPVAFNGNPQLENTGGDGNSPKAMRYPALAAVAGKRGNSVEIIVLNRSYSSSYPVDIKFGTAKGKLIEVSRLGPFPLRSHNDDNSSKVNIQAIPTDQAFKGGKVVVPERSLTRMVFRF